MSNIEPNTSLNWYGSAPQNPKNGDCFYNADESIVCVYAHGNWYNIGPLEGDTELTIRQLFRDKQLEKIINTNGQDKL